MKNKRRILIIILAAALATCLAACDDGDDGGVGGALNAVKDKISSVIPGSAHATIEDDENAPDRDDTPSVPENAAPGKKTFAGNGATVDYSNVNSGGYVMVKYEGDNKKIKVQISNAAADDPNPYTYDLAPNGNYDALPLTQGNGEYTIAVYLNISGDKYSLACQEKVTMKLKDEFAPYLRPSQYVNYTASSKCVAQGTEIVKGSKSDLKAAEDIFLYVVENVSYDYDKAASLPIGYLPDVDETLETGKGICFDFAALTTAMLRSQRIPSKLIVGYAGSAYHAWIAIYSKETAEFAAIIEFKADKYNATDPTFTAAGDNADPNVVGDGSTYKPIYYY